MLAKWLDNAKFYISKYQPVPVEEHLVLITLVYRASSSSGFYKTATQLTLQTQRSSQVKPEPIRLIRPSTMKEFSNPLINAVISLADETTRSGYGVLVFCSSRLGCEQDAILISQIMPRPEEVILGMLDQRMELLNDLRSTSTCLDYTLEKTISVGVAFHRKDILIPIYLDLC
jgi:hypothetical protein